MPTKKKANKAVKKTTRATKARKTATPDEIKKAQQDESHAEHVAEHLRDEGVDAHAHHGVPEVETHELTTTEILTAEAKDAGLDIYQITSKPPADEDVVYFAAYDSDDAKREMQAALGHIPDNLISVNKVDALPEGAIFSNTDYDAKLEDGRERMRQAAGGQEKPVVMPTTTVATSVTASSQPSLVPGDENSQDDDEGGINPLGGGN